MKYRIEINTDALTQETLYYAQRKKWILGGWQYIKDNGHICTEHDLIYGANNKQYAKDLIQMYKNICKGDIVTYENIED